MSEFRKVSFVIPALNEEESIGAVLRVIPTGEMWERAGLDTEVLVVDSDSSDSIAEIAQDLGARVVNEPRRGYGSAIIRGFFEATGDILVKIDADGTYPLEGILHFVTPILRNEADFVIGNRFKRRMESGAMPLVNMVGNKILSLTANALFQVGVWDTQRGLRVLSIADAREACPRRQSLTAYTTSCTCSDGS